MIMFIVAQLLCGFAGGIFASVAGFSFPEPMFFVSASPFWIAGVVITALYWN